MEEDNRGIQKQNLKSLEAEFNTRFGWLEIAHNVAEYTFETFFETMERNVAEVLVIATLLSAKVEVMEAKYQVK